MLAALLLALGATASPVLLPRDLKEYSADVEIHSSCNSTQRRMLSHALGEMNEVAAFARDYAQTNGPEDPVFTTYFGTEPEAFPSVIGAYQALLGANKKGVVLRCDDPDGNCKLDGWRGHWRGENATSETVICDASYTDRLYNSAFCMFGFDLSKDKPSVYWSIDLIHRLYHVPEITNEGVAHYADGLKDVTSMAKNNNSTDLPFDSAALQYFAAHVYAIEVAKGGEQCVGHIGHEGHGEGNASASASASTSGGPHQSDLPEASSSGALPPSPTGLGACVAHGDHWDCEGPPKPTGDAHASSTGTGNFPAEPSTSTTSLPPSPTNLGACSIHGDHWHCDGPPTPTGSAQASSTKHAEATPTSDPKPTATDNFPAEPSTSTTSLPPSPTNLGACSVHGDHWHCAGPPTPPVGPPASSTKAEASPTGDAKPSASSAAKPLPPSPTGLGKCVAHGDHWDCEGPPKPTAAPPAPSAAAAGGDDCHTHADGTLHCGSHRRSMKARQDNCHYHADGTYHCGDHRRDLEERQDNCHYHADGTYHCGEHRRSLEDLEERQDNCHYHADGTYHCGDHRRDVEEVEALEKRQDNCHYHADGTYHCGDHRRDLEERQDNCHYHADGTYHCGDHRRSVDEELEKRQDNCHYHADGTLHCGEHRRDVEELEARQDNCHYHADGTLHCGEHRRDVEELEARQDNCHYHADGTYHCGDHRRDLEELEKRQCHYHADGTLHCGGH